MDGRDCATASSRIVAVRPARLTGRGAPADTLPDMSDEARNRVALAALIVGLTSWICCVIPACGGVVSIAGVVLGVLGLRSERRVLAIIGLVASVLGLVLAVVHMAYTAQMIFDGDHPFLRPPGERPAQSAPADAAPAPAPASDAGG